MSQRTQDTTEGAGTSLRRPKLSDTRCLGSGCLVSFNFGSPNLDVQSGAVVFDSCCDPFGTNADASDDLFATGSDGSGLRQLTHTQAMVTNVDGSMSVEYPGPHASGPHQ